MGKRDAPRPILEEMVEDFEDRINETVAQTQNRLLALRWAYWSGQQPKIYLTPKLAETFRALADSLTENYCTMAINSRIHRLEVTGWDGPGAATAEDVWTKGGFPLRQDAFYRWGLVHGHSYLAVDEGMIAANPATTMFAYPDPDDWNRALWAGKCWTEGGDWYVTLWDDGETARYVARNQQKKRKYLHDTTSHSTLPPSADNFVLEEESSHGFDQVPVIPVNPYGYLASPMIDIISPIQDRINKLVSNKLIAAEFGAFKQRVFFTRQQLSPEAIRQQPDTAIVLDPGDGDSKASVQEMSATDLGNYDDAKNAEVDALFTVASLPRHMRVNPGSAPSGEAIKADEAPFIEAITDHQREFGQAFVQAFGLLGVEAEPMWRNPVANDDLSNARVVGELVQSGVPWQALMGRYLGWSPDEVEEATALIEGQQATINQQTEAFLTAPNLAPVEDVNPDDFL